jgi:hypothetical protein
VRWPWTAGGRSRRVEGGERRAGGGSGVREWEAPGFGLGRGGSVYIAEAGPVGKWAAGWWFVGWRALLRGCQPGSMQRELFAESKAPDRGNFTQI